MRSGNMQSEWRYSFIEAIDKMLCGYKITPIDINGPIDGYFEYDSTKRAVYYVNDKERSRYSNCIWNHVNDIFVIK